jgi:hypothetical protein
LDDEMGGTCNAHGANEKFVQNFSWKAWKEESFERRRYIDESNIEMDIRELVLEVLENLTQNMDWWRALVNRIMSLRVP